MIELKENLMQRGVAKLVNECAGVGNHDSVLIVCDYESFSIANQLCRTCLAVGAETNMMIMQPVKGHGDEPPPMVAASMEKATVVFAVTSKSISHTNAVKAARASGARILTMPEFNADMLISGAIEADFLQQRAVAEKVRDLFTKANTALLVSDEGTNLRFDLSGRFGRIVDGIARETGSFGAPPNIEASIAPIEGSAMGTAIVNASIAGIGLLSQPVRMDIEQGRVISIVGGVEAEKLKKILDACNDENVYMIGELGIGLNPKAQLKGTILEDEAVLGSVHIALGSNANFGGSIKAARHIDSIFINATLEFDGVKVVNEGKLNIDLP